MSVLVCNVGTRDLVCAEVSKERRGERLWASELRTRYAELAPMLRLPIISKALKHLYDAGEQIDQVVLIASDQPRPSADDPRHMRFWEMDTCETAQVIRLALRDGVGGMPPIPAEQITLWTISDAAGVGGDPSDYDVVLGFLERRLPALRGEMPDGNAYFEISGGTPAMTTGLLIAGTEVFGARATILAVSEQRPLPSAISTGKRLLASPLRAALRSNTETYAYDAALRTLREQSAAILDRLHPTAGPVLNELLKYAHHRYNFDFQSARTALDRSAQLANPWAAEIAAIAATIAKPSREALLAEVIHGAAARYEIGLYLDFLTQIVRFEENVLRAFCLHCGVIFVNKSGQPDADGYAIQRDWLRAQAFQLRGDRDDGRNRPGGRTVMRDLLGYLADERHQPVLAAIDRLRELVYLRNETTHSLDGVQRADLAKAFSGQADGTRADAIIPHLSAIYTQISGKHLGESPFAVVNRLIDTIMRSSG